MTIQLPKTCSIGGSKTGLVGTIGVTLLNPDGSTHTARATADIYEIGGGCYGKNVLFADNWKGNIKWDSGGGSPVYAVEEYNIEGLSDEILEDTTELQGLISASKIAAQIKGMDSGVVTAGTIAMDAIGSSEFAQAAADKVWSTAVRALTDKEGFTLSTAAISAIWDKNISTYSGAKAGTYLKTLYNDWSDAGRLDLILDAIAMDVVNIDGASMVGTNNAALATVCTEARLSELAAANLPADVDAILADTGTDGVVTAAGSKTGYALSSAGIDAILDEVVENTTTLRQMLRILTAALAGKSAGGGTATVTFRDIADLKDRIVATVDVNGNRTAISVDGT